MKIRKFLALASLALLPLCSMQAKTQAADDAQMNRFIDGLMAKMTLQRRSDSSTSPSREQLSPDKPRVATSPERLTRGEVGGLFNLKGVKNIRDM